MMKLLILVAIGICQTLETDNQLQGPCKDTHRDCRMFGTSYCRDTGKDWENWMRKNCAKKCNFCATPLTAAPTAASCQDRDPGCHQIGLKNCRDSGKSWEDWMRKYCANSCNFCGVSPTKASCKDHDPGCHQIDLKNCRDSGKSWEDWMRKYCAKSCKFCGAPPTAAPTGASCKDQDPGCHQIGLKNCRDSGKSWEDWMRNNCAKSCNFCGGGKPTSKAPVPPTAQPEPPLPGGCGQRQPGRHLGVVGGEDARRGDWPWQILMLNQGQGGCGGALISDRWVVTAAHCVYQDTRASSYKVRVGETDQTHFEGSEVEHQVKKVIVSPSWSPNKLRDDIALFLLETPVQFNKFVQPACLPKHDAVVGSKNCYISGWGKIRHPGRGHPQLQQAMMPPVDSKVCERKNKQAGGFLGGVDITSGMLCAGEGGVNAISGCHGDSGGPYVCEEGGRWYLHGAVSHGSPSCKSSETYTVFARVSHFRSWIIKQMKNYS